MVVSYLSCNIKGSIGISTASSGYETAWGYANFCDNSPVHRFGSNTESESLVSFKCFHDNAPRDYCEVGIVTDKYPKITDAAKINITIGDYKTSLPYKRNYDYEFSDGKHNVIFFAVSSEDKNLDNNMFQYLKEHVSTILEFSVSW